MQLISRRTALCFLPYYVGIVEPAFLDHQPDRFDQLDKTVLIDNTGTRPLHRLWIDRPDKTAHASAVRFLGGIFTTRSPSFPDRHRFGAGHS